MHSIANTQPDMHIYIPVPDIYRAVIIYPQLPHQSVTAPTQFPGPSSPHSHTPAHDLYHTIAISHTSSYCSLLNVRLRKNVDSPLNLAILRKRGQYQLSEPRPGGSGQGRSLLARDLDLSAREEADSNSNGV